METYVPDFSHDPEAWSEYADWAADVDARCAPEEPAYDDEQGWEEIGAEQDARDDAEQAEEEAEWEWEDDERDGDAESALASVYGEDREDFGIDTLFEDRYEGGGFDGW